VQNRKKKDFIFIEEDGIYVVQLHKVECESPKWASEEDKTVDKFLGQNSVKLNQ
jgi:ribosomal protein S2